MRWLFILVGFFVTGVGCTLLVSPLFLRDFLLRWLNEKTIYMAAGMRIVLGTLFIIFRRQTRFPTFILVMGILALLSGLTIPLLGAERALSFVHWWLAQSAAVLRSWAIAACLFGLLILRAGL
ncbi:MAG: hypothetical protein LHV69_01270 [Elusimicrobia bacterium]|nr:hypothetical protein [Candidatus Obscuribacterium magneticum]